MALPKGLTAIWGYIKKTISDFSDDGCDSMAAAIAYYTIFSLPPLLVIVITVSGFFFDPQDIQGEVHKQLSGLVGSDATEQVQQMIARAQETTSGGGWATAIGIVILLIGSTGAFVELQFALNRAWGVTPDPAKGGLKGFLFKRVLSLGMVLGLAFLLLVSLVVSAVISAFGSWLASFIPDISTVLLWLMDIGLSLLLITILVGTIFKLLPDAKLSWKDVRTGAFVTTVLFLMGKYGIGIYLGNSNIGTLFGAAGSLAIILTWIYYSAMIFLLGAEFTQVWAQRHGRRISPEKGATETGVVEMVGPGAKKKAEIVQKKEEKKLEERCETEEAKREAKEKIEEANEEAGQNG